MNGFEADAFASILPPRQRASNLEGTTLGNWKLVEKLSSSGGFGVVYKACHARKEMGDAAVKVFAFDMHENPEIRTIFDREIAILKKLTDARDVQGVPRIYDADVESSGLPWIAMQYIEGQPLDKWLQEARLETRRPLKREIVRILTDILAALATVQQAFTRISREATDPARLKPEVGIVHRDLKPSNVIVESSGSGVRAWVLDFGVARILQPAAGALQIPLAATTTVTTSMLTAEYASPEMLVPRPAVDHRSDIFQVGQIAFELVTGERYWNAWPNRNSKLAAAKYPWWLKRAIRRALQWDRERRFSSARQFLLAMDRPYQSAIYDNLLAHIAAGAIIALLVAAVLLSVQHQKLVQTYIERDQMSKMLNDTKVRVENLTTENTRLKNEIAHTPGNAAHDYDELVYTYNRLKEGVASKAEVDELRANTTSFLNIYQEEPRHRQDEVKALLSWLDFARTNGTVTVTVQQLKEEKFGTWAIDCGIDFNGRTVAKTTKNVDGTVSVDDCTYNTPWDPDLRFMVWIHLTDTGYDMSWFSRNWRMSAGAFGTRAIG